LLRWYRRLIAKKYDGSKSRSVGRPKTATPIGELICVTGEVFEMPAVVRQYSISTLRSSS